MGGEEIVVTKTNNAGSGTAFPGLFALLAAALLLFWPTIAPAQASTLSYETADPAAAADPSFKALFNSWKQIDQGGQSAIAIPSAEPVKGVAFTSSYGVRSDPFRGTRAMHAGIDLAGPVGTPIYATADGVVGRAEYHTGGYGNLVELDHGRGIQTRYGHLSKLLVTAGQRVKRGDKIGLMGSTGRSTGSHLHYEVRLDGKAVNPIPFMQSADYLQSVQRRASAVGGPAAGAR